MIYPKLRLNFYPVLILLLIAGLSACRKSVVSDSPAQSPQSSQSAQPAQPPTAGAAGSTTVATAASPSAEGKPEAKSTVSPTPLPILKEAAAHPGVPVTVPESMRRPLTGEELQKALQQLPPEVRARIQGMQAAPQGVRPQTTPQPAKKQ